MKQTHFTQKPLLALVAGLTSFGLSTSQAMVIQDFETDNSGVTAVLDVGETPSGNPVRVASGGVNIPTATSSLGGNHFAEVAMIYGTTTPIAVQGDRLQWNDGAPTGGYRSGYGLSVDVFFDEAQYYFSDGGSFADGFYFQPTLLNDGNVGAVDAGGFGVRLIAPDADPLNNYWQVGADGAAKGYIK